MRAHASFFGHERYDYVAMDYNRIGQVLLFFTVILHESGKEIQLCLMRTFTIIQHRHASGLQPLSLNDGYEVFPIQEILRPIHVVPDFATVYEDTNGCRHYGKYLINHDVCRDEWSAGIRNMLRIQDEDHVSWPKRTTRTPAEYKQADSDAEIVCAGGNMVYKGYNDADEDGDYKP